MRMTRKLAFVSASLIALSTPAFAQADITNANQPKATDDKEQIIVTGSQIRGIAPAGSTTIGVSAEQIAAIGATSADQLLAKIPQAVNFFNSVPQPGGGTAGGNNVSVINRPNLRNLPGASTSGGALTLILMDGHRVVGGGIGMIAVDPDFMPVGAVERVEAITDGGSAVYGSDAVGGVINFITRRRFDGIQAGGHYGFADNYKTYDANLTVGKDWGTGSAYISYSYSKHDPLYGINRDYVKNVDWNSANATFGLGQNRSCDAANITVSGRQYPLPNMTLATLPNTCDISDYQSLIMGNEQHHGLASLTQQLSDSIRFDVKAYYTWREDRGSVGPARGSVTMRSTNPNYRNLVGTVDAGAAQTVAFSYGPAFGNYALTTYNKFQTWNVTPSVTADLGGKGNWQLRALMDYGESTTNFDNVELFTANQNTAAASTVAATALNPYNIASTPAAVLASLLQHNLGIGRVQFNDYRVILDGGLFTLPGGDVKIAIGAEHNATSYSQQKTNTANYTLPTPVTYHQNVSSLFGEAQIPLFSDANGFAGMQELTLSASGRYDKYNDFGHTFNPKLALTWKPVDWISFTGNWGKSFRAPSPSDQLGPLTSIVLVQSSGGVSNSPAVSVPNSVTYNPPLTGQYFGIVLLRGNIAGVVPETSKNWSIGTKIQPPFVPGLTVGASYYRINYVNAINSPIGTDTQAFFTQFPNLTYVNPTPQQVTDLVSQVTGGVSTTNAGLNTASTGGIAAINTTGGPRVAVIFDARGRNLGIVRLGGIDYNLNYKTDTSFGSVDFGFNGNLQTLRKQQLSPTAPIVDMLTPAGPVEGRAKAHWQANVGTNVGNFRAQATLYHSGAYPVLRAGTLFQDRVGAFNVVNLFFKYDVGGDGIGKDLTFTVNVDNVFDTDPPIIRDGAARANGFGNGFTIGRLVQFGINKKF